MPPPLPLFLGGGRSGTTLVRTIFDSHPELAVAFEAHFVGALAANRYGGGDGFATARFVADLFADWKFARLGVTRDQVDEAFRLSPPTGFPEAVRTVLSVYAANEGKPRYGDKTPGYAMKVARLGRLFPEARFVHVIRDGRDAAVAFSEVEFGPGSTGEAAMYWKQYVSRARRAGQALGPGRYAELRYEELVEDPETVVRGLCPLLELDFDPAMLAYRDRPAGSVRGPDHPSAHQSLARPLTKGLRDWRRQMAREDQLVFEAVAGDLLGELGYERTVRRVPPSVQAAAAAQWARWQGRRAQHRGRALTRGVARRLGR